MRIIYRIVILALASYVSIGNAQVSLKKLSSATASYNAPTKQVLPNEFGQLSADAIGLSIGVPIEPMSALVSVPNSVFTGIAGKFDLQTNGRGLHNIQIDPTDPQKIHACVMTATSSAGADTVGSSYPSRRVVYTYSGDGGLTWSTPKPVSSVRTGYPDMILYKRGNTYVPIISAHRYVTGSTVDFISAVYIEQGAPGTGDFAEFTADNISFDKSKKSLLWPVIALSPDQTELYMLGDYSDPNLAGTNDSYFEFGKYALNADATTATWKGWSAQPGAGDGEKGFVRAGSNVLRVASDGTIGVLWINPDAPNNDHSLYFIESKDKGATWPTTIPPLMPSVIDLTNNRGIVPEYGLDFFYEGTVPHFVWQGDLHNVNDADSGGFYYPYSGQLFYWSSAVTNVQCLHYTANRGYDIASVSILGNDPVSVDYLYESTNFGVSTVPTGIKFPSPSTIAYPTFARTTNPLMFGIFYQTISDDDVGDALDRTESAQSNWFSNIHYQFTKDGGLTWSEPKPYKANGETVTHLDYRFPEASAISPATSQVAQFKIMFQADSLPGQFSSSIDGANGAGYGYNYWFVENYTVSGVKDNGVSHTSTIALGQNYPNPSVDGNKTTVPFALKNDEQVTLSISDMLGREVAVAFDGRLSSGEHTVSVSLGTLPGGVYQYTLKTKSGSVSRLMTVIK